MMSPTGDTTAKREAAGADTRAAVLERVGRKCRRVAEEAKLQRPRAKLIHLEEIPHNLRRFRRLDYQLCRRTRRRASALRRKSDFAKALQKARPLLHPPSDPDLDSGKSDEDDATQAADESEKESASEPEAVEISLDDVDDATYQTRIEALDAGEATSPRLPSSNFPCVQRRGCGVGYEVLEGGLKVEREVYGKLFDYQKRGVQWMWELHKQKTGGIIGDEMGLGKTAQVLSFLGGLHGSGKFRPSLVLCPVTLLRHWLDEIRKWAPRLRACILHDSICRSSGRHGLKRVIQLIRESENGILMTTYEHLRIYSEELLQMEWGYVVLDEGHKIKNPDADITLIVKRLRTRHRIIMTGSPVQNKLAELWSLFDFIFPGKLGTLPVFETEFGIPIQVGGYKNASRLSVSKAIKCATILRDIIMPYMLIRRKNQVDIHLPTKQEHVLFCTLSEEQRGLYKAYTHSPEVESIISGKQRVLAGIDVLRKICNHPDLLHSIEESRSYGEADRSGKLKVALDVLKLWKEQGDKVLIFTQTQMMLDILEFHLQKIGYMYYRMDGCTAIRQRDQYIKSFNADASVFAFLLTTKVGGLGVNLTGANRVMLYDPDWNPSVDVQARERAWRIGQEREVTIYRLITGGTIEEKIYQRQLFKQLLTDKVLKSASQKRLFTSKRIRDLFTMDEKPLAETQPLLQKGMVDSGDSILQKLLEQGGVKNVLDQQALENTQAKEGRDPVSYQATQEAERALGRMQTAAEQRSRFGVHRPTWTGRNGYAGAPPSFEKALEFGLCLPESQAPGICQLEAPSSSAVLKKLQLRRSIAEAPSKEPPDTTAAPETTPEVEEEEKLLEGVTEQQQAEWKCTVLEFFRQRGGVVESTQLNTLAKRIDHEKRLAFRSIVRQVATKLPDSHQWVLNPPL